MAVISTKGLRRVDVTDKYCGQKLKIDVLEELVPKHRARKLARQWDEEHRGKSHSTALDYEPGMAQPGFAAARYPISRRKQAAGLLATAEASHQCPHPGSCHRKRGRLGNRGHECTECEIFDVG